MQTMEANPPFTLRPEHPQGLQLRGGGPLHQLQGCPEGSSSPLQNLKVPEGMIVTPSTSLEHVC